MQDKIRLSTYKNHKGTYVQEVWPESAGTDYIKQELYDKLEADNEQLKAFAGDVLYTAFEDCEVDSEYMQASALKHGLLKEVGKSEPCGEACLCADYGIDFPTGCYQFTEVIATPKESTP